jgi:hypothetical protein
MLVVIFGAGDWIGLDWINVLYFDAGTASYVVADQAQGISILSHGVRRGADALLPLFVSDILCFGISSMLL